MKFLGLSEKRWIVLIMIAMHSAVYHSGVMDVVDFNSGDFVFWLIATSIMAVIAIRQVRD